MGKSMSLLINCKIARFPHRLQRPFFLQCCRKNRDKVDLIYCIFVKYAKNIFSAKTILSG